MTDRIKIRELTDRQLLEFHLTNQIVIMQKLERIYNHLKEQNPDSNAIKVFRHYEEIYDELFSCMDYVQMGVESQK